MAARLEKTYGTASMFYTGSTPWHRDGHKVDLNATFDEKLRQANLIRTYSKVPVCITRPAPNGEGDLQYTVPNLHAIVRDDTGQPLAGVGVSDQYALIQPEVSYSGLRPLEEAGLLQIQTGGSLDDGARIWVMGAWNLDSLSAEAQDTYHRLGTLPYLMALSDFTGRSKNYIVQTSVVAVCHNTVTAALAEDGTRMEIVHKGAATIKALEAAESMAETSIGRYEALSTQYAALKAHVLDMEAFERIVLERLAPAPKAESFTNRARYFGAADKARQRRQMLTSLWNGAGCGLTGDHSAWEAQNAVTEALDHDESGLWSAGRNPNGRIGSLLDGSLGRMKRAVTNELVAVALRK